MKTTNQLTPPDCYTHLGFAEYSGEEHLYDGNYEPRAAGALRNVIQYLTKLRTQISAGDDSLRWEGQNGYWYSGREAFNAIDREIARLTN